MPYKVWEDKLRTRVRQWYKMLQDTNGDIHKVLIRKLVFDINVFTKDTLV